MHTWWFFASPLVHNVNASAAIFVAFQVTESEIRVFSAMNHGHNALSFAIVYIYMGYHTHISCQLTTALLKTFITDSFLHSVNLLNGQCPYCLNFNYHSQVTKSLSWPQIWGYFKRYDDHVQWRHYYMKVGLPTTFHSLAHTGLTRFACIVFWTITWHGNCHGRVGKVLDLRSEGLGFEPHNSQCFVVDSLFFIWPELLQTSV